MSFRDRAIAAKRTRKTDKELDNQKDSKMDTHLQAIQERIKRIQERIVETERQRCAYKEFTVKDFHSFHDILSAYRVGQTGKNWVFRGHSDPTWKLLPKIGRPPFSGVNERGVFEAWKRRAIEYISTPPISDWDWLAIAQHHGLATRFLDWTTNPLNAAYFSVCEQSGEDAVLFAASFEAHITYIAREQIHPMDVANVALFWPRGVVGRITRQGGVFSVHGDPTLPLEAGSEGLRELHRIVIDRRYRSTLLSELSFYGVNSATLFPDLDGLSSFVNWVITNKKDDWKSSDRVHIDGEVASPQSDAVNASSLDILEKGWPLTGDRLFVCNSWATDAAIATFGGERLYRLKNGFKNAADLMVDHTAENPHERPNLVWPIVFCYRHYIELAFKDVIDTHGSQVKTGPEIKSNWSSHKLKDLWIPYKRIVGSTLAGETVDDIPDFQTVEACINEFDRIDPGSYTFRYPVEKDGRQIEIPFDSIDLYHLRDVMERLCNFFDAVESSLDEHFDPTKRLKA